MATRHTANTNQAGSSYFAQVAGTAAGHTDAPAQLRPPRVLFAPETAEDGIAVHEDRLPDPVPSRLTAALDEGAQPVSEASRMTTGAAPEQPARILEPARPAAHMEPAQDAAAPIEPRRARTVVSMEPPRPNQPGNGNPLPAAMMDSAWREPATSAVKPPVMQEMPVMPHAVAALPAAVATAPSRSVEAPPRETAGAPARGDLPAVRIAPRERTSDTPRAVTLMPSQGVTGRQSATRSVTYQDIRQATSVPSLPSRDARPSVHIGNIEVRIEAPRSAPETPAPVPVAQPARPNGPPAPLARTYLTSFGLRQG